MYCRPSAKNIKAETQNKILEEGTDPESMKDASYTLLA